MNKSFVGYAIGKLLQVISGIFIIPLGVAVWESHVPGFSYVIRYLPVQGFLIGIFISLSAGTFLTIICKPGKFFKGAREGFAIVALGWITIAFVGSIPLCHYLFFNLEHQTSGAFFRCFTDAYFETMSGFTTTGATVFSNIEAFPKSLIFWRSFTHWFGGMGIITLILVVFPALGVSGYQMFRGEVPGPTAERLLPRLTETAKMLWGVYVLLSIAEIILLLLGGMPLFDASCHTFGTMATGGFSTKNASIGYYNSNYFEWVIIIFMYLAGINFIIHYKVLLLGRGQILKNNRELHFYTAVIIVAIVVSTAALYLQGVSSVENYAKHFQSGSSNQNELVTHLGREHNKTSSFYGCFRHASFQVVSLITTTGYCTADFDAWPDVIRFLLVILMFFGGCIGSTGGGMKMGRIMILLKAGLREIHKSIKPKLIAPLKIRKTSLEEQLVTNILSFAVLYISIFVVCSFLMILIIPDISTAVTSVIATLNNIGPGLSGVGATQTYAWIPLPGKWLLVLCMLLGRLELFTVLAIFLPSAWKK